MTYSIVTEGLVKRFDQTRALDGIDLAVRTGSVFGLLGPNGAGKTTAVRILATLVRPDACWPRGGRHDRPPEGLARLSLVEVFGLDAEEFFDRLAHGRVPG